MMTSHSRCFLSVTFVLVGLVPFAAFAGEPAEQGDAAEQLHRVASEHGVVAADHRIASEAGAEILADGGNAADAGVTALLALGVANPFGSGLGGGGFCLYRPVETGETTVLDFRETAPAAAHRDLYEIDGEVDHSLARHGGLAVATPGEPAGLWALHGRFGQLEWPQVVEPARRMADQGIPVGATLGSHLETLSEEIARWPDLAAIFEGDDGKLLSEGELMVRDDLVRTLTILRDEGVRPFYVGEVADGIAETVQRHRGILTTDDLASYGLSRRSPVVAEFGPFEIHSMPPPSSGGIALVQALNIVEQFPVADDLDDAAYLHLVIEALKHAFADRARWLGDTDFVDVPVERLLSTEYAAELAERVDGQSVLDLEEYGHTAPDPEHGGTSHLSIADGDGNLLACTTTINTRFGSMVAVPEYGIILNNEMADFNVEPGEPNIFGLIGNEQNAVEAGKRPLSSMSPTLVLHEGQPWMTLGASGGPTIISGVYFVLLQVLNFDRPLLEAVVAPRIHHQWIPNTLFLEFDDLLFAEGLAERGHDLKVRRAYNAVQAIHFVDGQWIGVSDPRKGGIPAAAPSDPEDVDGKSSNERP